LEVDNAYVVWLSTTWMSTIERGSKSFIWCVLHQFPNHVTQIVWAA
jgi:hypothetical protein